MSTISLLAMAVSREFLFSGLRMIFCFTDHPFRPGGYGQDIFGLRSTYIAGHPPSSVNIYIRRYAVSDMPLNDPKDFELWLLQVWRTKDDLLQHWKVNGRFPPSPPSDTDSKLGGWIETEVKLARWTDVTQMFVITATAALLASIFARLWNFVFHGKLCFDCV